MNLQEAWERYVSQVFELAEELFNENVKPFCEANDYEFIAGNGEWWFGKDGKWGRDKEHTIIDLGEDWGEDIPQSLFDLLHTPVPGMTNDLGSLMPHYTDDDQQREG